MKLNIIDGVVKQNLCIGCGSCLYAVNEDEMAINWNSEGFLVPISKSNYDKSLDNGIKLCPFNPYPSDDVRTENELAEIFLKEAPNYHLKVGRYFNTYAGFSEEYRLTSSSGGLATYIVNALFEQKIIDAVITVGEGKSNCYEYQLVKAKEDLLATSKTKYYPVTMANILEELKSFDGKVAVVGIGCFIKAIRLLQYYYPELREKIIFTVGIICGGLKSKFFTEYLAAQAGVTDNEFTKPQFRIKDYKSTSGDYSFGCVDNNGIEKQIKMRTVGDMWGSGMFKCNACDYCDDVTTELADISLGDAWLYPYNKDGKGTNVVVTRSYIAEELIKKGISNRKLNVEPLSFDKFLKSQQGSFNHRHKALAYRISIAQKKGISLPPKRHINDKITIDFKWVQKQRRVVRKESILKWPITKNAIAFDAAMHTNLKKLTYLTRVYHYARAIRRKVKK